MANPDNVTTGTVVTFTTDSWANDPKGPSQLPASKLMWGSRDATYTFVDDINGQRFPIKVGDPLPTGSNVIGGVTQSGAWTVGISGSVSLPTNAAQETGGNLASIATSGTTTATNTGTIVTNTTGLAKESGGNLATIVTNTTAIAKDSSLTTIDTDIKATQPRNITQFGSSNVVTGTGASGTGIPRVTVSNDSVVGITGSVAVTGTFFQATQPVSATSLPLPTNAAIETGGNLASIATSESNISGNSFIQSALARYSNFMQTQQVVIQQQQAQNGFFPLEVPAFLGGI